ncbi:hypothetical protein [Lentzea sp. HUAS12]|nr:hypothetical protein [Lentzea sp. HUAS12]USX50129.1 hypothetical protein ND450_32765 [Lentzea sp. HUAS12]
MTRFITKNGKVIPLDGGGGGKKGADGAGNTAVISVVWVTRSPLTSPASS